MQRDFQTDLADGQKNERKIARFLMSLCAGATMLCTTLGAAKPLYDFAFMHKNRFLTFEVKSDYRAHETKNLFVEVRNRKTGAPSGVANSRSAAFRVLFYLPQTERLISADPRKLISFIEKDCEECRLATVANAEGYLVPLSAIEGKPWAKTLEVTE